MRPEQNGRCFQFHIEQFSPTKTRTLVRSHTFNRHWQVKGQSNESVLKYPQQNLFFFFFLRKWIYSITSYEEKSYGQILLKAHTNSLTLSFWYRGPKIFQQEQISSLLVYYDFIQVYFILSILWLRTSMIRSTNIYSIPVLTGNSHKSALENVPSTSHDMYLRIQTVSSTRTGATPPHPFWQ